MLILDLKDAAIKAIRSLFALLCEAIYPLMGFAYDLFVKLATFELMEPDAVRKIYQRILLVITIVMVFYITFEFVKYVVQPDAMTDKEKGVSRLPLRIIAVIVLIAIIPNAFSLANLATKSLIKNDVVSKIILGKTNIDQEKFGRNFSWKVLNTFYYQEQEEQKCDGIPCDEIIRLNQSDLLENGWIRYMTLGINESGKVKVTTKKSDGQLKEESIETTYIHFDGVFAVVIGGIITWMLLLYCVDMGSRVIQIVYLQIIAPIAIFGLLSPKKDNTFNKWVSQTAKTYLDVFIRLAIINFVLLVSDTLLSSSATSNFNNADIWVKIALVLGLLTFAKRVPKLLEDLFPKMGVATGSFGLGLKDRGIPGILKGAGRVAGFGAGAIVGGATGLATGIAQGQKKRLAAKAAGKGKFRQTMAALGGGAWGAARGTTGGIARGAYNGSKKGNVLKNIGTGVKNQVADNKKFGNKEEHGYTLGHQVGDTLRNTFGAKTRIEQEELKKKPIESKMKSNTDIFQAEKAIKDEAKKHAIDEGKGRLSGEYKMAAQRVHDLRENGAAANGFEVGKRKYKNQQEADAAYESAKQRQIASVDKSQFTKDKYGSQEAADKAYENAKNDASAKVKKEEFNVDSVYTTQAEVDGAYAEALAQADKKLDAAEKAAIYDFLQNGEWDGTQYVGQDQQILNLQQELVSKITEYNGTALPGLQANKVTFLPDGNVSVSGIAYQMNPETGQMEFMPVAGPGEPMTQKQFNDYTKTLTKQNSQEYAEQIANINANIARIKAETEGSGIGEGKK